MKSLIRIWCFICLTTLLSINLLMAQENSVVLIHTNGKKSGYGVAFNQSTYIVTALHVVSGSTGIQVVASGGRKSNARIIKILRDKDLALLKIDTNLGLVPMAIGNYVPGEDLLYWETPTGYTNLNSKGTTLGNQVPLRGLDIRFRRDESALIAFKNSLCSRPTSYPSIYTEVIKFENPNINKAHSGSPITKENRVIGLVDGGERPVDGAKSCVWAIPATYFDDLISEGVSPQPRELVACNSRNLYSGVRSDNPFLSTNERNYAKRIENTKIRGTNFSLSFEANFEDLYKILLPEDQNELASLFRELESEVNDPISVNELFDERMLIFEEDQIGVVLVVPQKSRYTGQREYNTETIEIASNYESISMHVYTKQFRSGNRQQNLNEYMDFMRSDGNWEYQEHNVSFDSPEYYGEDYVYAILNAQREPISQFYGDIIIDGNDFLGVAIQVNDFESLAVDREERMYLYLLLACNLLTDFNYH